MAQATGQRILGKKEVKLNNFFTLGSGIFVTLDYGILLDFEVGSVSLLQGILSYPLYPGS